MNESSSSRSRAMSKLMTPFVARAGVMISASRGHQLVALVGLGPDFETKNDHCFLQWTEIRG
jgi:hypothetical protein